MGEISFEIYLYTYIDLKNKNTCRCSFFEKKLVPMVNEIVINSTFLDAQNAVASRFQIFLGGPLPNTCLQGKGTLQPLLVTADSTIYSHLSQTSGKMEMLLLYSTYTD